MLDSPDDFVGMTTFVVGPGKGCGKTAFAARAAALARRGIAARAAVSGGNPPQVYANGQAPAAAPSRRRGDPAGGIAPAGREGGLAGRGGPAWRGGLALIAVGYEGEAGGRLSEASRPSVRVEPGNVFVTTERYGAPCSPELLDLVPGSTALGRLCVQRATRRAKVILVGPEGNSLLSWATRRVVEEGWADTVIVDGAADRLTPVASVPGARFVYAMRVDRAGLAAAVKAARRMAALAALEPVCGARPPSGGWRTDGGLEGGQEGGDAWPPVDGLPRADGGDAWPASGQPADCRLDIGGGAALAAEGAGSDGRRRALRISGALTAETASRIPESAEAVVVEDLTKVFLGAAELASFTRRRALLVERRLGFAGFSVACRGLSNAEFVEALGDGPAAALVSFNPYEAPEGAA